MNREKGQKRIIILGGGKLGMSFHKALGYPIEKRDYKPNKEDLVIECSIPEVARMRIKEYLDRGISFICASTGVDKPDEFKTGVGLIAPNLAIPVVHFIKKVSNIPFDLSGVRLRIQESHHVGKKDMSGTAIKVGCTFKKKGVSFKYNIDRYSEQDGSEFSDDNNIESTRNRKEAHGYHKYILSGDMEKLNQLNEYLSDWIDKYSNMGVELKLYFENNDLCVENNVDGRNIYSKGLEKAIKFVTRKLENMEYGIYEIEDIN